MLARLQKLLKRYVELRLQLLEADLKEQAQELLVKVTLAFFYLFLASASLLLLFFGIAFYINEMAESKFLGFLVLSAVFLGLFGFFLIPAVRKKCIEQLKNYFSEK